MYIAAYWDEANYTANLQPWKPLVGQGNGTFLIDWTNNIYQVKFTANLLSLFSGQFEFQISDQGIVIYAMVQVKPTPYGPFDFWPISKIDVSGSAFSSPPMSKPSLAPGSRFALSASTGRGGLAGIFRLVAVS